MNGIMIGQTVQRVEVHGATPYQREFTSESAAGTQIVSSFVPLQTSEIIVAVPGQNRAYASPIANGR